jgi:hypothetical protein
MFLANGVAMPDGGVEVVGALLRLRLKARRPAAYRLPNCLMPKERLGGATEALLAVQIEGRRGGRREAPGRQFALFESCWHPLPSTIER